MLLPRFFSHYIFSFAFVSVKFSVKLQNWLCSAGLKSWNFGLKICTCNFHMSASGGSRVTHVPNSLVSSFTGDLSLSFCAKTWDKKYDISILKKAIQTEENELHRKYRTLTYIFSCVLLA